MARIALLSVAVLLANLGADGSQAGLCGQEMGLSEVSPRGGPTSDILDGGHMTDDAGVLRDGGVGPDGGAMGGSSGKALHLVNAITGEDLGFLVALPTLTVYVEKFDALIELGASRPTMSIPIYFAERDCNGKRYMMNTLPSVPRLRNKGTDIGATGTYLRPNGPLLRDPPIASYVRNYGGTIGNPLECVNSRPAAGNDFTEYVDTGMKPRPPDEQLKVELR